ncbi:MAG: DNA polymerase III subunit delta' [Gammaproteobacteria bacterium]
MSEEAMTLLCTRLCPWLEAPFGRLEAARRADRLGSAWLISGPPGIGKLNLALALAARLLGVADEHPPALGPADASAAMRERRVPADHHPDLHLVFPEPEKRTIGIEQIRELSEALSMKGFRGGAKAAVIEPAEAMTLAAANALLKTLEEPAAQTFLLLVSHQPHRLLPTIRSRCQVLAVAPPSEQEVAAWLGVPQGHPVLSLAGRAPLPGAALIQPEKIRFLEELGEKFEELCQDRRDPRALAEEWVKQDLELALQWLIGRLEGAIRGRFTRAPDSNAITPKGGDPLHNAWRSLSVRALFERLDAARRLLDRLGSGINVELALHALLVGFRPQRGRS